MRRHGDGKYGNEELEKPYVQQKVRRGFTERPERTAPPPPTPTSQIPLATSGLSSDLSFSRPTGGT